MGKPGEKTPVSGRKSKQLARKHAATAAVLAVAGAAAATGCGVFQAAPPPSGCICLATRVKPW